MNGTDGNDGFDRKSATRSNDVVERCLPASGIETLPGLDNQVVLNPVELHLELLGASEVVVG